MPLSSAQPTFCFSTLTRNRTWNLALEERYYIRLIMRAFICWRLQGVTIPRLTVDSREFYQLNYGAKIMERNTGIEPVSYRWQR